MAKVSILMPIFQAEKYLAETLDTVFAQTFGDWEVIVMDGGSKDATVEILKKYAISDPRVRFWSEPDEGPYHAIHKALEKAQGEFVCVLCASDGWLDKDWLKSCVETMESDPEVSLVWGVPMQINEEGKELGPNYMFARFLPENKSGWRWAKLINSAFSRIDILHPIKSVRNILRLWKPANLKAAASFVKNSKPLHKREWFNYWLETGVLFPDNAMFMDRKMFMDCLPPYHMGTKEPGDWMSFYYNFNARGYLSYCFPRIISFARVNSGSISEKFLEYNRKSREDYLVKISALKTKLVEEPMQFRDRAGNKIG